MLHVTAIRGAQTRESGEFPVAGPEVAALQRDLFAVSIEPEATKDGDAIFLENHAVTDDEKRRKGIA